MVGLPLVKLIFVLQVVPPIPASRTSVSRPMSAAASSSPAATARKTGPPPPGMSSCKHCGRHFASDRVSKHEPICQKSQTKKRKVFDPVKHRVQGTEAEKYVLTGISARNAAKAAEVSNLMFLKDNTYKTYQFSHLLFHFLSPLIHLYRNLLGP